MTAKRALLIIAGCLLVLGISGYFLKGYLDSEKQKTQLQQKMKNYLDITYERDFTVSKPFITGNEGFGYNMWIAEVYPTDESDLKFHIAWGKNDSKPYQDSYLVTRRSAQGKAEIGKYLKEVYGQDVPLTYKLSETVKDLERLDHNELLTKHGDTIAFELVYYVFLDSFDKQSEAERVYKVYNKFVLDNHVKRNVFVVNYLSNNYKQEFDKGFIENQQSFLARFDSDKLYKEKKLINKVNLSWGNQDATLDWVMGKFRY